MDGYSRFILSHKLQRDMISDSLIEAVQEAVDRTGITRTRESLPFPSIKDRHNVWTSVQVFKQEPAVGAWGLWDKLDNNWCAVP